MSNITAKPYRKLYFAQFVQKIFSFKMDIICFDLHPHEDISNSRTRPKVLISSVILYVFTYLISIIAKANPFEDAKVEEQEELQFEPEGKRFFR